MKDNSIVLFSIIVPTYNRSSDLVRCLDSLAAQTYTNFEVIVCDNASTDNTKEVVDKYKSVLDIKYIYLTTNSGGPARPRNIAASSAIGEWVCFLDSDDWYKSDKLDFISKLNLEEIDFIYHDLDIIQNGMVVKKMKSRDLDKKDSYHDLLYGSYGIPTSSVCVRKSIFTESIGFSEKKELIGLEDYYLWIELAKTGIRFKYISIALGYYFLGSSNLSLNDNSRINRYKFLFQTYIDSEKDEKNKKKINATLNYHIGWIYFNKSQIKEGIRPISYAFYYGSLAIKFGVIRIISKSLLSILK
ncbi:glycosyltransferase family A protein [Pedobacter miscanthi]|uniref:glycosyltransferase family 2 protein n=1 Tax=Pedobacter miscanthi TaxID=2259170 RepID=UPI002930058B|nr:glycosyltransferase family A protein [Pedobacter miscanthi]